MALLTAFLACCAAALACMWLHQQLRRPDSFPPGPFWFPLVGNLFLLKEIMKKEKFHHKAFEVLSQNYNTSVLGLKLGQNLTVVVSGVKLVHEVFTKEEFQARPDSFFIRLRCLGTRNGVTCTDGELWHEQRAFVLRYLRQIGSMENILLSELSQLQTSLIASSDTNKIRLGPHLATAILNVLWTIVAGFRLSNSNFYLEKMLKLLEKRTRLFDMSGGLLNHLPWLRFIAPNATGYKLILDLNKELKALFQTVIHDHEKSYDPSVTRDLIDAFLHQGTSSKYSKFYTESQLIMICLDLFIAGSQTTSNTLDFALMSVMVNPLIQDKVRQEIWSVIGEDNPPGLHHRTKYGFFADPFCHGVHSLRAATTPGFCVKYITEIKCRLHSLSCSDGVQLLRFKAATRACLRFVSPFGKRENLTELLPVLLGLTVHPIGEMPYVEAVLTEVYRFCQVTPVAGPRQALKDTELNGYRIPKNTTVLINLHSVHMDPSYWGDPERFRPERFLTSDGKVASHGYLMPFGLGRRRCLGEVLARNSIFLFFTGILQRYNIQPAAGEEGIEISPVPGMTMAPKPYNVKLTPVSKLN